MRWWFCWSVERTLAEREAEQDRGDANIKMIDNDANTV